MHKVVLIKNKFEIKTKMLISRITFSVYSYPATLLVPFHCTLIFYLQAYKGKSKNTSMLPYCFSLFLHSAKLSINHYSCFKHNTYSCHILILFKKKATHTVSTQWIHTLCSPGYQVQLK